MEGGNYADSFVQLGKVSANKWQNFSVCVIAEPPQIEFNPTQCPYWPSFFRYQCFWGVVVCHKNWNWGRILSSFQVCTCSRRSWIREGKVEQLGHSSICNVYHNWNTKHATCFTPSQRVNSHCNSFMTVNIQHMSCLHMKNSDTTAYVETATS